MSPATRAGPPRRSPLREIGATGAVSLVALAGYAACTLDSSGLSDGASGGGGTGGTPSATPTTTMVGGMGGDGGLGAGSPMGGGGSGGEPTGGGGQEPLTPSDVPDCILWLRADLDVTEVSGAVSGWANQCQPGQDATQPVADRMPTFVPNGGPASTDALDFVRSDADFMHLSIGDASSDYALYVVLDQRSETTAIQSVLTSSDTSGQNRFFSLVQGSGAVGLNDGTAYRNCLATTVGPQWLSWELNSATTTLTCTRNGVVSGDAAWSGVWSWSATPTLGAFGGAHPMDGLLAEVILYRRVLTEREKELLRAYLFDRYGL